MARRRVRQREGAGRLWRSTWRVVLLAAIVIALVGVRRASEKLERRADDDGLGWVDPAILADLEFPSWADQRWTYEYEDLLVEFGAFQVDDEPSLSELHSALSNLSFVREVHGLEAIWPDELVLDLSLRRPVACVPVGNVADLSRGGSMFRTVGADGTLLTGLWERPPRVQDGWLPVLGPLDDDELVTLCSLGIAGDYLVEPEHLDALDVALSLDRALAPAARENLGRVVIDASRAAFTSVEEPGVRLDLEDRRRVLFGRAPSADAPGERPADEKWRSIARGMERFGDPLRDWEVLDVRWDVPDVWLRNATVAQAADSSLSTPY